MHRKMTNRVKFQEVGSTDVNFQDHFHDEDNEGSLVLSDIEFPSHVSDLESFHSDYENSVQSFLNEDELKPTSNHPQQNFEEQSQEVERRQQANGEESSEISTLPELPEQAEENVNLFLAALKAATFHEESNESDEGSNHAEKSDVSRSSSNLDSYRFISKESFPESMLTESSQSWSKDLSLNPDELRNQPSSTPFCAEAHEALQHTDSRMSEKFLAPSKTPENGSNVDSAGNITNPWSFSGASVLLQTPAPEPASDSLGAKIDNVHTPETLKKPKDKDCFSTPLQRKLWANNLSVNGDSSNKALDIKNSPSMGGDSIFNPFDDSVGPSAPTPQNDPQQQQMNPFESNDGFSFNQDLQDDFSFQSGDDAARLLAQDEAEFVSTQVFDKEEVAEIVDSSMFSDYVLPGSFTKTGRQSVVGINDPDDKGEVRVSFGKFFAARTEELGSLNNQDKDRPRPQFESGLCTNESPEAGPPRPLYRPSHLEGSEAEQTSSPAQYSKTFNVTESEVEVREECASSKEMRGGGSTRSLPYGAEDDTSSSVMIGEELAKGSSRDSGGYKEGKDIGDYLRKTGTVVDKGSSRGILKENGGYEEDKGGKEYLRNSGTIRDKVETGGTLRDYEGMKERNGGYSKKGGTNVQKEDHGNNTPNRDIRGYLGTNVGKEDREEDQHRYQKGIDTNGIKEQYARCHGTGVDKQGPKENGKECQRDVGRNGGKEGYTRYKCTDVDKEIREKKRGGVGRLRRISSIDPNDSTLAALQYCQSSEGSKVMSMSTSELKLLSSTLAKVTQGESNEIYKVLVKFINRRKSLSNTASDTNMDSLNYSDVFSATHRPVSKVSSSIIDQPGSPDETDGMTFYHSDTSCDVSPTGSKFQALDASAPSPPLDSSSPKSAGSSIAVQTEPRDSLVPSCTIGTTSTTTCARGTSGTIHGYSSSGHSKPPSELPIRTISTSADFHAATTVTGVTGGLSGRTSGTPGTTVGGIGATYIPGSAVSVASNMVANAGTIPNREVPIGTSGSDLLHPSMPSMTKTLGYGRTFASVSQQAYGGTYSSPNLPSHLPQPQTRYRSSDTSAQKHGSYITMSSTHGHAVLPSALPPQHQPVYSSGSTVYHTSSPVWTTTCVQNLARTAPVPQAHLRTDRPGLGMRIGSLTDQPIETGGGVPPWEGTATTQCAPKRQEHGWNWRTERSSEIQMVIPPTLDFPGVLCVGLSAGALLPIHNPTTRWIRCSSVIIRCSLNGVEVDPEHDSPFFIRETTLIGPKLTENVEVEFKCVVAGIFVAEMKVISIPVGSVGNDNETSSAIVTIQGFSEHPSLEVVTENGQTLDFGELHEGYNGIQPFRVINKGRTAIPLKMLICSSSSPGAFIFSKKNSSDDSSNLEMNNTVLKCVLPAINSSVGSSEPSTIWVELVGKNYHCFEKSNEAEAFSALVNIQLDAGNVVKTLGNIALQGVIGATNIQIPKAFQMAMCLSSQVGQKVSRQLPFSNSGNISANVQLTIPKYPDIFIITPEKFSIKPGTTVTAEVAFCPRLKDSFETVIQISELAYDKSYEVLLRGSSVDQPSTKNDGAPSLLSNKSWLAWPGVDVGNATHKRLFLLNDSSEQSIQFQAIILGEHADFEIQRVKSDFSKGGNSSEQITLRPKERVPIYVLFAPSSFGIFKSALVLNQAQGPRFKVPLYAYGGTGNLCITETDSVKKMSNGYNGDLGQVFLGHRNIIKLTLKNTGSRAAFVKALCFADHQIRLHYPKTHLSIVPSEFVLPERSSKELVIVFQPLQHDAKDCQSSVKRVATVVLYYGDEVLRQWYKRNLSKQHNFDGKRTTANIKFDDIGFNKSFQDENCVAEDFDFPDLDDFEEVFDNHISQVLLHLHGGPEKKAKEPPATGAADENTTAVVLATSRTNHDRPIIRCETPAQKESAIREKVLNEKVSNESITWALIPEQLSLKVPVKGSVDSTKKVQLLNYTNRPLEFEFSWPAHCIAVTPHVGTISPKNQALIHISVWSSISSAGIDLPWSGAAYVNCDGERKALGIQIHKHLVNDDSPAPSLINKKLTNLQKDESLSYKMSPKQSKQNNPLIITPDVISFEKTEVGKVSTSAVALENVSSSSVRWKISSVAPAYAKVSNTSAELLRASYAVFRFSCHTGLIRPGQNVKVDVEFRARDAGVYCQIWDIQTNPESPLTSTKTQLELSGEAILTEVSRNAVSEKKRTVRLSEPVKGKIHGRPRDSIPGKGPVKTAVSGEFAQQNQKETKTVAKGNANVFFECNDVQFPDTAVGKTSSVKIKLCNKSSVEHQFKIISPKPPFTIRASTIPVKPGHFMKMPVYFSPTEASSVYTAVVSFENSKSGEILSVKVQGKSCKK